MKVLIQGPFTPFLGYGKDLIGMTEALINWGADVYIQPTSVQPPLPQNVAYLLTKELKAPFDLAIVHIDPGQLKVRPETRRAAKHVIGWTMWEWSSLDNLESLDQMLSEGWLNDFDAIVAYDDVTKQAFAEYYDGPIPVVQGGYEPVLWPKMERDWFGRFGFCMVGQLHDRKDPFAAIQAFQELKAEYPEEFEPAELHLKTNIPGLHSAMEDLIPKLRIHYAVWDHDTMVAFYEKQHVLLAPSRGEGKNLPALEFQTTGGAVIATNWGGMAQWLNSSYSYPLNDITMGMDDPSIPTAQNARVSIEELKATMLHVFRNRAEVKRKADIASMTIPRMLNWDTVVERFLRVVTKQVDGGDYLWMKAISCRNRDF
jgi:glycosyltransferase involved in cell wall biosynthesis